MGSCHEPFEMGPHWVREASMNYACREHVVEGSQSCRNFANKSRGGLALRRLLGDFSKRISRLRGGSGCLYTPADISGGPLALRATLPAILDIYIYMFNTLNTALKTKRLTRIERSDTRLPCISCVHLIFFNLAFFAAFDVLKNHNGGCVVDKTNYI